MRYSHRHLQHLLCRFLRDSRAETPQGSQPACASSHVANTTGSTRIRLITRRPSLFPTPIPAPLLVGLAAFLPSLREERYGLTTFHKVDKDGLGALCPPLALGVHDRAGMKPCTRYSACWLKPLSTFGLSCITAFTKSSHLFTIPSIQPPLRLMLADTPLPHGFGASQMTVGTVSEGFRQRVTLLPYLVGYCRWNGRSGRYNVPDYQPCDLVSQRPITGRRSLFPTPIPAPPLVGLTASLPSFPKERYGLTTFHKVDTNG